MGEVRGEGRGGDRSAWGKGWVLGFGGFFMGSGGGVKSEILKFTLSAVSWIVGFHTHQDIARCWEGEGWVNAGGGIVWGCFKY